MFKQIFLGTTKFGRAQKFGGALPPNAPPWLWDCSLRSSLSTFNLLTSSMRAVTRGIGISSSVKRLFFDVWNVRYAYRFFR